MFTYKNIYVKFLHYCCWISAHLNLLLWIKFGEIVKGRNVTFEEAPDLSVEHVLSCLIFIWVDFAIKWCVSCPWYLNLCNSLDRPLVDKIRDVCRPWNPLGTRCQIISEMTFFSALLDPKLAISNCKSPIYFRNMIQCSVKRHSRDILKYDSSPMHSLLNIWFDIYIHE